MALKSLWMMKNLWGIFIQKLAPEQGWNVSTLEVIQIEQNRLGFQWRYEYFAQKRV